MPLEFNDGFAFNESEGGERAFRDKPKDDESTTFEVDDFTALSACDEDSGGGFSTAEEEEGEEEDEKDDEEDEAGAELEDEGGKRFSLRTPVSGSGRSPISTSIQKFSMDEFRGISNFTSCSNKKVKE